LRHLPARKLSLRALVAAMLLWFIRGKFGSDLSD